MRIKTVTIAVLAALCLFQAVLAQDDPADDDAAAGADDDGEDEDQTTDVPTTYIPPVFGIELLHSGSNVNHIDVRWESHESFNDDVKRYYLTAQKRGSLNVLTSPDLDSDVREYLIEDLIHNSYYEVCLFAELKNGTTVEDCEDEWFTIEFIRDDSLIILFCVLGYIFLMILIGYLCWSYAKKKAEEEAEEEEEEAEKEGNEALLGKQRPQSAGIDDRDIPYITPPLSELEKEKSKPSVEV